MRWVAGLSSRLFQCCCMLHTVFGPDVIMMVWQVLKIDITSSPWILKIWTPMDKELYLVGKRLQFCQRYSLMFNSFLELKSKTACYVRASTLFNNPFLVSVKSEATSSQRYQQNYLKIKFSYLIALPLGKERELKILSTSWRIYY